MMEMSADLGRGDVTIVAINLGQRIAILDDDTVFPLTNFIDAGGDETDDPDKAVVAVGHLPDDSWVTFEIDGFEDEGHVQ